jgi:ectoine hydroxylase
MKLTPQSLQQFDRDGYWFFPARFSAAETRVLLDDDQTPEPRVMNVAIFLDEVNEFNGPLMFIPGSHQLGVLDAQHDLTTTSYTLWNINNDTIVKLVDRGGIVAPKGPAGSMIMFLSCLVHASTSNLSPWNRMAVYLSLCAVSNHIRRFKRPAYIAHRDVTPLQCLPDDCLLRDYDVPLPWKDGTPEAALKPAMPAIAA